MSEKRQIRRLAMQALYQLDARGETDWESVEQAVGGAPGSPAVREAALGLARAAWADRAKADACVAELAPAWPTHRQPPVDRSILRLAYHELAGGVVPTAVAINEAVELAKSFGAERSPAFINGVLDKLAKRLREATDASS